MLKDIISLTLKGIIYRKLRSWLTILGIILGVMLVVIILSLGNGVQKAISKQLQMLGSNIIIIFPGEETNPFAGIAGGQKFEEKDLMNLEKIPGVKFVTPMEVSMQNVEFEGEKKGIMIHGAPWKTNIEIFSQGQGLKLEEGEWPNNEYSNEVIFGYLAFKKLFKNKIKIGDEIFIKSKRMKVKGYISEIGNQTDDNSIYISMENYRIITGTKDKAGAALVKTLPNTNIDLIGKQIRFELKKQEHIEDFSILTPQKANQMVGSILKIIEIFLIIIALISLLVGAVGITNTMYTSVMERTKQIGIMKAIGASKETILTLFLIESGIIGLVGGIIGIIIGLLGSFLVGVLANSYNMNNVFTFDSVDYLGLFVILLITFITGIISGILPAKQASNLEAAEALRYE